MPRMRLLKDALAFLKSQDKETAITTHAIRELALQGRISSVMIGSRRLINVDSLLDYLATGQPSEKLEQYGKIRHII